MGGGWNGGKGNDSGKDADSDVVRLCNKDRGEGKSNVGLLTRLLSM